MSHVSHMTHSWNVSHIWLIHMRDICVTWHMTCHTYDLFICHTLHIWLYHMCDTCVTWRVTWHIMNVTHTLIRHVCHKYASTTQIRHVTSVWHDAYVWHSKDMQRMPRIRQYNIYTPVQHKYAMSYMCDITHMCDNHNMARHAHTCDVMHSYVWHDAFMFVTWLIRVRDMMHPYVWRDAFICVTWLVWVWHDAFIIRHVTHSNESCHTYEWVTSHIWMSHVAHMNESCYSCECLTSHIWMSHVTHMNESCATYE